MRYELKMVFPPEYNLEIDTVILNPGCRIREIYTKRQVNNIYFDTLHLNDYYANVNGNRKREKYRIRWYGDLYGRVEYPMLERKTKAGILGDKEVLAVPSFELGDFFSYEDYKCKLTKLFGDKDEDTAILSGLLMRSPVLINSYSRKYFLNDTEDVRITLDTEMHFYSYFCVSNGSANIPAVDSNIVVEFKFNPDAKECARSLISNLGFAVGKNSKYVNGINATFV